MKVESQIILNRFKPRSYQLPLLDAIENKGYKRVLAILPRRAGKDITALNLCIRAALKRVGTYFYVFPTYAQAKKVIWDATTIDGQRFINYYIPDELVESKNSQEMKIRFKNGSLIQLVGSDNIDGLVGTNPLGVIFSEYAIQDPRAYNFLRPILLANDGWCLFISTPRGKNHLWEMYQIALYNPDEWYAYKMTVEETGHISLEDIQKEKDQGLMSEDFIQQEFYCFPAGQHVLTNTESKPIEEIVPGELVVSHTGRPRRVLGVISREYQGDIVEISSFGSGENVLCTPNHPLRVYNSSGQSYIWKEADKITIQDRLVFPKVNLTSIEKVLDYNLCLLMAWYITDGSCFKNAVQFTVGTQEEVEYISGIIGSLGYRPDIFKTSTALNVVVSSCHLADFFKSNCGSIANNKRIPFGLIMGHEQDFFYELIKGYGCYSVHKNYEKITYSTVSKTLAYQIQLLSHSLNLGYAAGITCRKEHSGVIESRRVNCQKSYQVNIAKTTLRDSVGNLIRAKNCIAARIKSINKKPYSGKVYNLKVQYDESYLVHGRAVHNCSFELGVEGSYYAKYLDKMRIKGQIGTVPWEPAFKVHTAWDLGVRDSTSIIFFQTVGQTIRIIDCYENSKVGLEHYVKVINQKDYQYGKHIAPHDIRVKEWGTGVTRIDKARQLGINFTIAPDVYIEDGIEAVRSALSKIWIDETACAPLLKAIENYRQEYDVRKKVYKDHPLHDWSSHWADSLRYLCISLPKTRDGSSAEDLEKRYREAVYGDQSNLPPMFNDQFKWN